MKRLVAALVLALTLSNALAMSVMAHRGQEIRVLLDGYPVELDVAPIIQDGRAMVPFRAIAQALGVAIGWDGSKQVVTGETGTNSVWMQIDNPVAYRNGEPFSLDAPPLIMSGRTLIPIGFFSEAFGCTVDWDGEQGLVTIVSPSNQMTVIGFYALEDKAMSGWGNLFGRGFPQIDVGNTDIVSELAAGWYSIDVIGNLRTRSSTGWERPQGWETVLAAADLFDIGTEMVVHEVNADRLLDELLVDRLAVANMVAQITAEASKHYKGVNLHLVGLGAYSTLEQVQETQRSFTQMVSSLATSLHSNGLNLTLTLHPPNSVYRGYDYKTLGQIADRIIIMAYDYGPRPEPTNRIVQAVEQALKHLAPEKLVLGISLASENPSSILDKVDIAKRYQLQGIALWRLGLASDAMWQALRTATR